MAEYVSDDEKLDGQSQQGSQEEEEDSYVTKVFCV